MDKKEEVIESARRQCILAAPYLRRSAPYASSPRREEETEDEYAKRQEAVAREFTATADLLEKTAGAEGMTHEELRKPIYDALTSAALLLRTYGFHATAMSLDREGEKLTTAWDK